MDNLRKGCLPILILLMIAVVTSKHHHGKVVTTLITAKWEVTPLVLEIAEFIADESPDDFWSFVDDVSAMNPPLIEIGSERVQYEKSLELASKYLSPGKLKMLKLGLSLHIYSPKVEMFGQIASQREIKCPATVDVNGQLICTEKDLKDAISGNHPSKSAPVLETYRVDHHYPGSENRSSVAVLYGELGTPETALFHSVLRNAAQAGLINYVLRAFVKERQPQRVRLSGYGVELQMKSTEYKVMDDSEVHRNETEKDDSEDPDEEILGLNFYRLKQLYPDLNGDLDNFRSHLVDTGDKPNALKVWQVQELSLQAAERILAAGGEDGLKTLIHISHNFPIVARSLIRQSVRSELKAEIKKHQETFSQRLNLPHNEAALFLNGLYFDADVLDVFSLVESLRNELRVMEGLYSVGLSDTERKALLALDLSAPTMEYAIDIRDSAVIWANDIENDPKYRKWSDSLLDLLRPTFPGMLRSIRRNLFNLVVIVDPAEPASRPLLKLLESFYVHQAPLHIGVVYAVPTDPKLTGLTDASLAILMAVNYVSEAKDPASALSFVTDVYASVDDDEPLTPADVHNKLKSKYPSADLDEVFGEDSSYETGRQLSAEFIARSGLRNRPQALLNGIPLSESLLTGGEFEEAVLLEIMRQTPQIQTAVFRGELGDSDNILDYLMSRPNVMPRLNERILSGSSQYLDLTGEAVTSLKNARAQEITATLLSQVQYFTKKIGATEKVHPTTHWIVADLESLDGRSLLKNALKQMIDSDGVRLAIVLNPDSSEVGAITQLVFAALDVLRPDVAASYILKVLENEEVLEGLSGVQNPPNFNLPGLDVNAVHRALINTDFSSRVKLHTAFARKVLKWKAGERGIVTNGRVLGPLRPEETFIVDDFALLEVFGFNSYSDKVLGALKTAKLKDDESTTLTSDIVMKIVGILVSRPAVRSRVTVPVTPDEAPLSSLVLPPRHPDQPAFEVIAVLDPVSRGAQKLGSILSAFYQVLNMRVVIHLNCVEKNSDLPLKNFYRFVIEPELIFTAEGRLSPGPIAKFSNLPTEVLFTQAMLVPENWLVESIRSPYDLDNIKLDDILETSIHSEFELEYLLLEGHCFESVEASQGNPPRGLQITLGTQQSPTLYDTIVMANLGYFQLKANPGAWVLRLRDGRSSEIYDIISHEGSDTPENSTDIKVIISSFRSQVLKLRVQKKPDKQNMDLLSEDGEQGSGIWNSLANSFSGKAEEESDDVINIFSLASGHLYERFLKIMMLSVLKNTKTPVKFWFLKNYLSPTVKDFLEPMSKEYGFQYELVQYKWPRWLHQQTEKQRIIWGYKILFLDVLFPLHVKKIIFVDADQVVRTDLKELRDLDLGGAPYGYTPFCESRKEMDGFRFWKLGYWRNHLQGRRYHISALYVVDLKRFRRIAAGDRLRGQYQALSQDPNSLSNLDQDLPNNMIHQVAIKSLPQEWLWCETWCDDASKDRAKTIDLCNNPMTKEAKLTAAMRIVPEWKNYDAEIKRFTQRLDASTHVEEVEATSPTHQHSEL